MKKNTGEPDDDLRSEYDSSVLRDGVRGKYLHRYREGTNLAPAAPEKVAKKQPPQQRHPKRS